MNPPTPPTHQHLTPITPLLSEMQSSPPPNMLSPIMSQQRAKDGRKNKAHDNNVNSPISDALNLAAGAASLKKDFATCEKIMTEKHHFLVAMLDGMNRTVSTIAEKLETLETRIRVLEETEDTKTIIAQNIFSAANERYLEMEKKVRDCTAVMNTMNKKYTIIDDLSTRVQQMDKQLSERYESQVPSHTSNENLAIAIYGLNTNNDIINSVNWLFKEMNLMNIECVSAYRTPTRPGMSRPGVVIAEMRCLRDKLSVQERKRFIRHLPQYQHVFIKASKSHTEQVIDANFNIILNEMKNGDEYYVSDNGRIRRKVRDPNDHVDIVRYTDQAQRYNSNREHYGSHLPYDGAKPKQTQHYSQSVSHGNRNTDYVTTRDSTPPSGHPRYENTYRRPDVYTQSNNDRTYSDSRNFDQHRVRTVNDHTNYRKYTQRYNDRFVNKHHNQRQNNAVSSTYASKQKK